MNPAVRLCSYCDRPNPVVGSAFCSKDCQGHHDRLLDRQLIRPSDTRFYPGRQLASDVNHKDRAQTAEEHRLSGTPKRLKLETKWAPKKRKVTVGLPTDKAGSDAATGPVFPDWPSEYERLMRPGWCRDLGETRREFQLRRDVGEAIFEDWYTSALASLPHRQRETWVLVAEGNKQVEVAQIMNITKQTVGEHLAKAKEKLAARLDPILCRPDGLWAIAETFYDMVRKGQDIVDLAESFGFGVITARTVMWAVAERRAVLRAA